MLTRRELIITAGHAAGTLCAVSVLPVRESNATPATMQAAVRQFIGEAQVSKGKVTLDIPPLVENGNTVPLTVSVESPMTEKDHVRSIHIFNEKNPQPNVIGIRFSPRSARAAVSTRIRLADSQRVTAIAELSDGTFWSATADVIVTLAACVEGL